MGCTMIYKREWPAVRVRRSAEIRERYSVRRRARRSVVSGFVEQYAANVQRLADEHMRRVSRPDWYDIANVDDVRMLIDPSVPMAKAALCALEGRGLA